MTLKEFQAKLAAKHPGAEAFTRRFGEVCVTFEPNGRMYSHRGTIESIAEKLELIELWYVYRNGEVVGKAHNEECARELRDVKSVEDSLAAEKWGVLPGRFTFRRVS